MTNSEQKLFSVQFLSQTSYSTTSYGFLPRRTRRSRSVTNERTCCWLQSFTYPKTSIVSPRWCF